MVDHQQRVWQHRADGGLEHGAHVDRHRPDLLSPGRRASRQPAGGRCGGAALDLCEQALSAGQIHDADVPPFRSGGPRAGLLIPDPVRFASADLLDAEYRYWLRVGRQHP
jgi:hypothetical protein